MLSYTHYAGNVLLCPLFRQFYTHLGKYNAKASLDAGFKHSGVLPQMQGAFVQEKQYKIWIRAFYPAIYYESPLSLSFLRLPFVGRPNHTALSGCAAFRV